MDPFIGEIRLFAGTFVPDGWLPCDGRVLPIPQFQALYAVIGPTYGGDGRTIFAIPNLAGRVPMGAGAGPNLTPRSLAQTGGSAAATLTTAQMASHSHVPAADNVTTTTSGVGAIWGGVVRGAAMYTNAAVNTPMNATVVGTKGGGAPHNNMQPYLPLQFIIAYQGLFPVRD